MRLRLIAGSSTALGALIAAVLFCGIVLSVGLSAAPQLHQWLHKTKGDSHECAATLMSKGTWEHSACDPVLSAPQQAPATPSFGKPGLRVMARAETSILEHAPPANS
ncbi:MAG: hypothetical protein H0U43_00280 [Chthoniobacterales bacterium]|nr:hypothetical protein [Chthoniobacterales bacterium]